MSIIMATEVEFIVDDNDDGSWLVVDTGEKIDIDDVAGVDYRADPDDVVFEINTLLVKHKLRIELLNDGTDRYWFRIKTVDGLS
jgi:hypothetical protein